MLLLLVSIGILLGGGVSSLTAGRGIEACRIGAYSAAVGSAVGLIPAFSTLLRSSTSHITLPISLPIGTCSLSLDPLAAVFLIPTLILSCLCALYGGNALQRFAGTRRLGAHWLFYNLLTIGMMLVFTASDAFLFLISWEIMSLVPFFLISLHDEKKYVRSAAWIYLVASHLGALCLIAFFSSLSAQSDGFAFQGFLRIGMPAVNHGSLLFILMILGFGAKAGIMPLHVWLPEAHPAAPPHVSALMSGALISCGIYGILRCSIFLGAGEAWWGLSLMGLGAFSAFGGILFALAQKDIKRSLAYSSVENMGIICLAIGTALFARSQGHHALALLALTGGLLHMLNHSLFKGLLFLCAGAVYSTTGEASINVLGGLQKRMPVTGCCFALGAAGITALPPFNGFAGEFLLYIALAIGGGDPSQGINITYWLCLFCLAGVGGFVLLCFSRLYGIAFLGASRTPAAQDASDPTPIKQYIMLGLGGLCLLSALAAPKLAPLITQAALPVITGALPQANTAVAAFVQGNLGTASTSMAGMESIRDVSTLLLAVNKGFLIFILAVAAIVLLRRRLLRNRDVSASPTWDCGYIAPSSRMQYSGTSFAQPAIFFMRSLLTPTVVVPHISDYFPKEAHASLTAPDRITERWYGPLFQAIASVASRFKKFQHGRLNGYILYTLITLVLLLAWKVG